jgi:hypothetical protein
MRRREFIVGLGSAAAWPVVAGAQQAAMPVVGYLDATRLETSRERIAAVHRGLSETSYVECGTSPLYTAGRRTNSIGYRCSQPISSAAV